MIANCHLAFNCLDLQKSIEFYEKFLGCKKKFTLSYAEWVKDMEQKGNTGGNLEKYKGYAAQGLDWIVYMEWPENPGYFLELFYGEDRQQKSLPGFDEIGYTHFAVIVDDLKKVREHILSLGGEEYLDSDISLGLDHTWQMWIHDPDGNKIELMEYTGESLQLQ